MVSSLKDKLLYDLLNIRVVFAGYFGGINTLVNKISKYSNIHGLLFRWIKLFDVDSSAGAMVVRAIADTDQIAVSKYLFSLYKKARTNYYRFVLANSIYIINKYDNNFVKEISQVVEIVELDNSRCPLILFLYNSKYFDLPQILNRILDNPNETKNMKLLAKSLKSKMPPIESVISSANKRAIITMEKYKEYYISGL